MAQSDNHAEKFQHPVKEQVYLRASSRLATEFDRTGKLAKERMALAKDGLDGRKWTEQTSRHSSNEIIPGLRVPDFPSTTSETDSDYKRLSDSNESVFVDIKQKPSSPIVEIDEPVVSQPKAHYDPYALYELDDIPGPVSSPLVEQSEIEEVILVDAPVQKETRAFSTGASTKVTSSSSL